MSVIVEHRTENAFSGGPDSLSYEWVGEEPVVYLARPALTRAGKSVKPFRTFWLGALHLRVLEYDFARDAVVVSRAGLVSAWAYGLRKVHRIALQFYCRLILTAGVWGLAEVQSFRLPRLDDLYAVKHLKRIRGAQ